jgi:Arc/MetJ-type ribon-helix-helix transcriptional regulator
MTHVLSAIMSKAKIMTPVRLPKALRESLDAWCASHRFPPSRTDVIIKALEEFLEREAVRSKGKK